MQTLKGKRVSIVLDKETLELERQYKGLPDARPRSDVVRELYLEFLKRELEDELL